MKTYASNDNPFEGEEFARMRAEVPTNLRPLGDLPLIVLARGLSEHGREVRGIRRRRSCLTRRFEQAHRIDHLVAP